MGITSIPQSILAPWTRKHDKPGTPLIPDAPVTFFPRNLEDLITLCKEHSPNHRLHAAGSHWALSQAALADDSFIETHDFNNIFSAMGRTLFDVIPGCLTDDFLIRLNSVSTDVGSAQSYLVHFESGKRIYQLYSELDVGDSNNPASLAALMKARFGNRLFDGSWAFATLGGAGGQTVVGALSTGTHGGDFDRPPVADSVVALHVVADGGQHFWIERSNLKQTPFIDEAKLRAFYGQSRFGGPDNFHVIQDDNVFNAALIQVGRFGIVYSAVLKVVPQYGLRQDIALDTWENVRGHIADPNSSLFTTSFTSASGTVIPQRFLQIAINPIPETNGTTHVASITKHWTLPLGEVPLSPLPPVTWSSHGGLAGRPERVGNIVVPFDPVINAPLFSKAGSSIAYSPSESGVTSFSLFEFACQDANFMDGIVSGIYIEIENFLSTNAVPIGGALAAVIASGLGPGLLALAPWLLAILAILALFLNSLRSDGSTVGQALNNLRGSLLSGSDPSQRAAGIIVWRAIANAVFNAEQAPATYSAISYAIMDAHDYTDISCAVNVRSVEVFFDATDPSLLAFVDRLLLFEIFQEFQSGKSVAGYISLRFCMPTAATIGPQPFPRTVAVECSGLADELGSASFVDFAVSLAQDPNIKGILHWGQQNDSTQSEIEFRFGDAPGSPTGPLHNWRQVLSQLTDNGRLDGFSSHFTRRTGLEVVQPVIAAFSVSVAPTSADPSCTVAWTCGSNPEESTVSLEIQAPSGPVTLVPGLPLNGTHGFAAPGPGNYVVKLTLSLDRNGVTRTASQSLIVAGA
jgi:hypothetical protein